MKLKPIDRRSNLSAKEFKEEYMIPNKPVVLTDMVKDWPATEKWTFSWLKNNYGDLVVPLCDESFHNSGSGYMAFTQHMPLAEYLDIIEKGPSSLRMFAYNIFKEVPELRNDFFMPNIVEGGWQPNFSYMFFGGKGSTVNLHYDIDYSETFLTQFQTRKRVTLFSRDNSTLLYQEPYTVKSLVDLSKPDYEMYPGLKYVNGYDTVIGHGETIYIPHHTWHFIEYVDGGFGMNIRAHQGLKYQLKGLSNIARHFVLDKGMNKVLGERWSSWKKETANKRAEEQIAKLTA